MSVAVLGVNVGVVIDEVFVPGVVRRIYVDNIDFALVSVSESCQGFEVITLNDYVIWIYC